MDAKVHLAWLRESGGIAQRAAAERTGTTQPAVSRMERDANPRLDGLRRYVRQVLGGELHVDVGVDVGMPDGMPDGRRVPLALGPEDPGPWGGPAERYGSLEGFYRAKPGLAQGWGYVAGERGHGAAPYGSREIRRVCRERGGKTVTGDDHGFLITFAAPAAALGPHWERRTSPVVGDVTATSDESGEILVLARNVDLRPAARALRRLQRPSLEEVGAAIEGIARDEHR